MRGNSVSSIGVVGAGPAGLATAVALSRAGYRVTAIDHANPSIDKACGEGLMPDSIASLKRLGIELPGNLGFPFRGIQFSGEKSSVAADFPNGMASGIRRTALHKLLVSAAESSGVTLIWNAKRVALAEHGLVFDGHHFRADLVVGADGQNSLIRRQAGMQHLIREKMRFGFRRHYSVQPWSPYMEIHWGSKCQIYVTPVGPREVCIASISADPKLRLDDALRRIPAVRTRLANAAQVSPDMGACSVSRRLKRVFLGSVALIGDASGSVDAITGEGMCLAFKQAAALADALDSRDLSQYEIAHRALMRRPRRMAALMLTLDTHHEFQRRALAALQRHPQFFATLVGLHVGAQSITDVVSPKLLNFGVSFLAA